MAAQPRGELTRFGSGANERKLQIDLSGF